MIELISAQTGRPLDAFIALAQEYVIWMLAEVRLRYPDMDTREFASEHAYDDLRKKFPGEHMPPAGDLLVAMNDGEACGCVAVGPLTNQICELRTLFVRPSGRKAGIGRRLTQAALEEARRLSYQTVRLDTLTFMESAQSLYRSLGFIDIPPYLDLSESLKRHICFMELQLSDDHQDRAL